MNKEKIILVGGQGKMGQVVFEELKNDYEICIVEKNDCLKSVTKADLVIDFASAESSVVSAEFCRKNKIPLIVGSTGQNEIQMKKIKETSKEVAVLKCGNFSVGMALVRKLVCEILKTGVEDVVIFEKHHKNKKDAPSGTAKELQKLVNAQTKTKVQMLFARGGSEIGTHEISFYFGDEVVSLKHQAFSRKSFAKGVKIAVEHMLRTIPEGLIKFDDVVKF